MTESVGGLGDFLIKCLLEEEIFILITEGQSSREQWGSEGIANPTLAEGKKLFCSKT